MAQSVIRLGGATDYLVRAFERENERAAVSREACAMADEEGANTQGDDEPHGPDESRDAQPPAEVEMELRDSLPGGRAVVGVEQEGQFIWLASKKHVSAQARDEFLEQFRSLVGERRWTQNWSGGR